MHQSVELEVVTIACLVLAVGAATLMFAKRTRLPYTILMLLLGIGATLLLERAGFGPEHALSQSLGLGAVSSDLIIFVFLPALVFESAYSLDVHAFLKNIGVVSILAGPALLFATALTAALMFGLTASSWQWSFAAALVFGALISATDPVAVVAVLKEAGAPKSLALLIEGESLLNDGTAIVVFGVLLGLLTAASGGEPFALGPVLLRFVIVVAGGVGVGLGLAILASAWLSRTFDDPMVEITVTIALAYAAMIVAEGLLHVSGVLAVVTAGLWMKGPGRTRISPEVAHFLHHFWELLAYMANTLIFYLVGMVIAAHLDEGSWTTVTVVILAYAGIMLIRFLVTFASLPLVSRLGDRVSRVQAIVMSWGGLRGAVSLALALIVSQTEGVGEALGTQILEVTTGVVLLTILVNGSSTGWLLRRLGLDRMGPSEELAALRAEGAVLAGVGDRVEDVARSPELRTVQWSAVREELGARRQILSGRLAEVEGALEAAGSVERAAGFWGRALAVERRVYRQAFAEGTLGSHASQILDHELDLHHDRLAAGIVEPPEGRLPKPGWLRAWLTRLQRGLGLASLRAGSMGVATGHLALLYDLYRAQRRAAAEVRRVMGEFEAVDPATIEEIQDTYAAWGRVATERLEDLRVNLPELTSALETRLAIRLSLNFERDQFLRLAKLGELTPRAAEEALGGVRERMKRLHFSRDRVELPETAELCRETPLFAGLDEETIQELAEMTKEEAYGVGDYLFHAGDRGEAMYILARGSVHVLAEDPEEGEAPEILAVLGGGEILGEMALLTGERRNASARAATSVTVGRISSADFERLMQTRPEVRESIWQTFSHHALDNTLRRSPSLPQLPAEAVEAWLRRGEVVELEPGEALETEGATFALLVHGALAEAAPALIRVRPGDEHVARARARIVLLGDLPGPWRAPEEVLEPTPR
ncbi:MAG: cation:proton antiporter [Myxococcales bacterium]|nr:cation:proton antiporter [Myxococcales bacterium]